MKKLFAVILSLAMVLGMCTTAFAAKTGATLKVKGLATNAQQNVDIYEIYRLDSNDNGWVAAAWTKDTGVTPENLNTSEILEKLKTAALYNTSAKISKVSTETDNEGIYSSEVDFEGLQAGAYLVLVTDSTNKTTYSTMVAKTYKYDGDQLISPLDEEVVAKAEGYHTDKSANKTNAEVGDLVTYTIETVVPYQTENASVKEFKVSDTLTGAKFYLKGNAIKGVTPVNTLTVNGVANDELKLADTLDGTSNFTLDLMSLVTADNKYAGQKVVITYTALVTNFNEITNKATSTQDPNGTTTYTYNGNATITKIEQGTTNKLKGAEFVLYRVNENNKKEYAVIGSDGWITGEWIEETTEGAVPENAGRITTADDGTATVRGLKTGEYYFKEVVAPDGYSINTNDVKFTMSETKNAETVVTGVAADNAENIVMPDTKLSSLPSTGGIGTTIFTIAGCAIMIAAAGFFFASRKKANK